MKYQEFDWMGAKETADRVADLLGQAGIRLEQRVVTESGRTGYVIAVHPDDMDRAWAIQSAATQQEFEAIARTLRFVRQPYATRDMLIACESGEGGYYASEAYHGQSFDETRFRVVRGGWDHEHCFLCHAKVIPGDEWWAAQAPGQDDQIGVCLDCHARLFGGQCSQQL